MMIHHQQQQLTMPTTVASEEGNVIKQSKKRHYMMLLAINYAFLFVGSLSSTLLSKFYFVHGGSSRWVSTLVQCAGFPLLIPPIFFCHRRRRSPPFAEFTGKTLWQSVAIGVMLGFNNLLFSWGTSYLPVSTSSLLLSSQLAFTLLLSALIVRQRITFSNLNCVVLLTLSSLLLAFGSSRDRPRGLTRSQYFAGFFCTVGAGLLFALYLPLMERVYRHVRSYAMVMEMQLVMEAAATAVALVGMAAEGGFAEMRREAAGGGFGLGEAAYWWTLAGNVVTWQMCFLGTAGMVFLTTSITGGICMTALMGMNVVGGVVAFKDEFSGGKAVATLLCAWGFSSYVYGMIRRENSGGGGDDADDDDNKERAASAAIGNNDNLEEGGGEMEMIAPA